MKNVLLLIKAFFSPPKHLILLISPAVFAVLIYILSTGKDKNITAYIIYGISAYCLTALILLLPEQIKTLKAYVMRRVMNTVFGKRYMNSLAFRGIVSIYQSMIIDFLYALFRITAGIIYGSLWFVSMAIYYSVLGILRLSLALSYRRKNRINELQCYRRTARLLFLLNIPMGVIILLTVFKDYGYSYPGYVIYLSALYTFYAVIISVINIVKFKKLGIPVLSAAKVLNFVAAIMSVLGLQTAMITRFSSESENFRIIMNAVTGATVWGSVIVIAAYMLLHSQNEG